MASAKATIDHETIRKWVEAKGGCPAQVKRTANDDQVGIIRIDYPGYSGKESLEEISWDEFFEKFEDSNLAFLYQDEEDSRFSKLVSRDSVDLEENEQEHSGTRHEEKAHSEMRHERRDNGELAQMTADELYERAKDLNISGRSSMRKKDLIKAIEKKQQESHT